jgi:hypothetical protein
MQCYDQLHPPHILTIHSTSEHKLWKEKEKKKSFSSREASANELRV